MEARWVRAGEPVRRQLTLGNDGLGQLLISHAGSGQVRSEAPLVFALDERDFAAVRGALVACRELPRATWSASAGLELRFELDEGTQRTVHEARGLLEPPLRQLADAIALAVTGVRADLATLAAADESTVWRMPQGHTARAALVQALGDAQAANGLVRFAAPLAAELGDRSLVPHLRGAWSRARDQEELLLVATTLLALGEPLGTEDLVQRAQSTEAVASLRALGALNAAFSRAYGRPPLPSHDYVSAGDPRPEAAQRFLAWFRTNRDRLRFEPVTRSYIIDG